ncbi:MAG TPA: hypothetical protein VK066_21410 [Chloroflexota bacterium]|nr:hypothetical protein [Chloroflexota bacterium]
MSAILDILRQLAAPGDAEAAWARLAPALVGLSLDDVEALDYRIALGEGDGSGGVPSLKRRVVEYLQQRKLAAFVYECFDPFVNPWALEARMKALFWRIEYARSLSEQLEEIAEAHKHDVEVPWTVKGNLFGMANSALLAANLGGWDDTVSGYGQGEPPPARDFRPRVAPRA